MQYKMISQFHSEDTTKYLQLIEINLLYKEIMFEGTKKDPPVQDFVYHIYLDTRLVYLYVNDIIFTSSTISRMLNIWTI